MWSCKRARWFLPALLLLLVAPLASAQQQQGEQSAGKKHIVPFDVDFARFRSSDSTVYLESYLWVSRSKLDYKQNKSGKYVGGFSVDIKVLQGDSIVNETNWKRYDLADSLGEISESVRIPTVGYLILKPGKYRILITVRDLNNPLAQGQWLSEPVRIDTFPADSLAVSDIELATNIRSTEQKSEFVKNGLFVQPNPTGLYGTGMQVMYFYSEIYNLDTDPGKDSTYAIRYRILDGDGNQVRAYPAKVRVKKASAIADVGGLNIISLKSGTYYLFVDVTDNGTGEQASSFKKFYVFRKGDYSKEQLAQATAGANKKAMTGAGSPGTDAQRYDVMSEKELDKEFDYCRYIATRQERKIWKKLDLQGKRDFIKKFWADRDQTPGTPENEFKRDYLMRVEMANRNFGGFREGYKTDRGRVLLMYGRPDEIERFPFSMGHRAYQIWHYYSIQGGVDFIFVDKREMGDYELVHSNARGEMYDPDWQRWLDPNR